MDDIKYVVLSDISEINPPTDLHGLNGNTTVSFIPMADVSESGEWINQQARPLKDVRNGYTCFQEDDILFAKITPCMENGKGVHAAKLVNRIGFGTTEFHILRAKSRVHSRFIYHWIMNEELRRKAEARMTGSAGQRRVPASFLGEFKLPFFPLSEQRRIAEILDTIDEAIQKVEALISKLKAMKQGLLHDLLTRGLDKNGKLRGLKAHPEQFKDSPLGRIPREWDILRVKDFVSVKGGKRLPKRHFYSETPTKYRYLRVLDFFEREIDYNSLQYLKKETFEALERYEIQYRNVFISIAGSIGYTGVFNSQIKDRVILTENAARLVIDDKFQPEYYAFQLNSGIVQDQILKEIGTGGGVPKLALHRIENLKVICPSINEQMRIVNILNAHDARIRTEEQYRDKLKLQKKGLMHDLLTGKVRVKV